MIFLSLKPHIHTHLSPYQRPSSLLFFLESREGSIGGENAFLFFVLEGTGSILFDPLGGLAHDCKGCIGNTSLCEIFQNFFFLFLSFTSLIQKIFLLSVLLCASVYLIIYLKLFVEFIVFNYLLCNADTLISFFLALMSVHSVICIDAQTRYCVLINTQVYRDAGTYTDYTYIAHIDLGERYFTITPYHSLKIQFK